MVKARHLLQSSVIVVLFLGLDKITALIRTRLVSVTFGTGDAADAFTAANQLPEVFVTVISGGALAAAFIPVYSNYLSSKSARESAKLASSIISLVIVILGSVSAIGIVFAPWITKNILAPEFSPAQQLLTANLMRVILLEATLFGVSGVLSSILNAHQHFALPALAPVALNIGYIAGFVFFVPLLGIHGLAWGLVLGGLLHILIQVPGLIRYKFRYLPMLDINMSGVKEIVRLMGPRIITLGSIQIADIFIIRLTSGLPPGSTSGYFYGYYLMQLPETLFGTAIAIVVFPTMAELYNSGDIKGLKDTSMTALRIVWLLTIPASIGLVLLGRVGIAFFLEGGAFTAASTNLVYSVLIFFSLRIVSEASLEILARLFYAQHDTRTPMFVALVWLATNIILAFLLVGRLGVGGLALASTIAFTIQSLILFLISRARLGDLGDSELAKSGARFIVGAIGMTIVVVVLGQIVTNPLLWLFSGVFAGLVTYFGIIYLLGSPEITSLLVLVRTRSTESPSSAS